MKDISIREPIPVILKAGEWFWILGLLSGITNEGENRALDSMYRQIMDVTE